MWFGVLGLPVAVCRVLQAYMYCVSVYYWSSLVCCDHSE